MGRKVRKDEIQITGQGNGSPTIIKFEDGTRFEMRIRTSKDSAGQQA